jgi:hypothetical protein
MLGIDENTEQKCIYIEQSPNFLTIGDRALA